MDNHAYLLGVLFLVGTAGCDSPDDFDNFRESGGGTFIGNGLHDPDLSGINPAFALSSPQGLASDHGVLLDPAQFELAEYLVECALAEGQSISKPIGGGEEIVLEGLVGLAPEWKDNPCDQDCQEWVSACLMARTNVSGEQVDLWLRAAHPAIGEQTNLLYPHYEASFFGNLFEGPEAAHYCEGTITGPLLAQLEGRTCAGLTEQECGFTKYTGCAVTQRCEYPLLGLLGLQASARDCMVGDLPGPSRHTISTYVATLPL